MNFHFISAIDVLMPRGNRAFGDAGQHGEALAMPWPSAFAGALRSALLARDARALAAYPHRPLGVLGDVLGTPAAPGSFRLAWLSFATRDARGNVEPMLPLPADRIAFSHKGASTVRALRPSQWPAGMQGSGMLPMTALLRGAPAGKPVAGWLSGKDALRSYLHDDSLSSDVSQPAAWGKELRLGIALDAEKRTAAEGALYTSEALRFARRGDYRGGCPTSSVDGGYLVAVEGTRDLLPATGMLRLGGDGRAAQHVATPSFEPPAPPLDRIAREGRFRLVLLTPAVWPHGWLPAGVQREGDDFMLRLDGMTARLTCASLGRREVISGWDLAARAPKPAQRAVPAGAVYWFDRLEGDVRKLAAWIAQGVWHQNADMPRRAEGFNNALLGAWPRED